jgi:hypothetical protein
VNIQLLAASAMLSIFGALTHEANAAAEVSLCNDGDVIVAVIINNRGTPQISGWWQLEPHSCGAGTSGGMVDITVGFFPKGARSEPGRIKYYDFEPPKLYKPGLSWVPADDAYVEKSTRWACAYKPAAFKRSGLRAELESCPNDDWESVPFVWRVWAYPDYDRYYNLHFKPSLDSIKDVRNK